MVDALIANLVMPVEVGYAAVLERFGPGEAVELSAYAESHGSSARWPRTTSSRGCPGMARARSYGAC